MLQWGGLGHELRLIRHLATGLGRRTQTARCRTAACDSIHRIRQRVFPHLDRQPADDGAHPELVSALGQDPTLALLLRQHPRRRPRPRFPWQSTQDVARLFAGGCPGLCVFPVLSRLAIGLIGGLGAADRALAGFAARVDAISLGQHQLARPAISLQGRRRRRLSSAGADVDSGTHICNLEPWPARPSASATLVPGLPAGHGGAVRSHPAPGVLAAQALPA